MLGKPALYPGGLQVDLHAIGAGLVGAGPDGSTAAGASAMESTTDEVATACGSAKEVRAALYIASHWGYIETRRAEGLDAELDRICAITWCLSRGR